MGSPLEPSLANASSAHHEQNCLDRYYRRYVYDIFLLFRSSDHLKRFKSYLNSCHVNMSFTIETEQNNEIAFLDVNVICEECKFITSIYRKPTSSVVYTQFDSFIPDTYKIGIILHFSKQMLSDMLQLVNVPSTIDTFIRDISEKWLSSKLH